jgi:hypothetical protein
MTTNEREYLISILMQLRPFPDSNNAIIPYLKSKPDKLQGIKYIYFTYIGNNFLFSLCHGINDNYIMVTIKNNECMVYEDVILHEVLQKLTKTERKNIAGIKKARGIPPGITKEFHIIDYLRLNKEDVITKLDSLTDIFDISGLLFITDEVIACLSSNSLIKKIILNNNINIRNIRALISIFPNVREVYLNNMKHIKDEMIFFDNELDIFSIVNCSVTMRVLLSLTKVKNIILNSINLECQTNMYSTVITDPEWTTIWRNNICTNITIISNNLTFDCIKAIISNAPALIEFRLLDIILCKLRDGAVKSGHEKETITFTSIVGNITFNRDLKWKKLLIDNCYYTVA